MLASLATMARWRTATTGGRRGLVVDGGRPHWPSTGSSGGRSRLGGGQPIEEVVHLIYLYFHFPLTTSDVLQLLLVHIVPM
jgi:hypothetical protein